MQWLLKYAPGTCGRLRTLRRHVKLLAAGINRTRTPLTIRLDCSPVGDTHHVLHRMFWTQPCQRPSSMDSTS